ncbi:MAG: hypothetical protein B5M53_07890 [Candidatus Cloacimonas sp. 4484_209]|nr:MAG: hypothetical protein B5M53_07890 [Candidatus Cloacimonas sp. 4484_209]
MKLNSIDIEMIGLIHRKNSKDGEIATDELNTNICEVEIFREFSEGLKDIESFSHLHIFYILHKQKGYSLSVLVIDIKPYSSAIDAKIFANNGWLDKRKTNFTPRVYEYKTYLEWKKGKEGILTAPHKPDVRIGCPPEFGGEPYYWSPEHLLVASVDVCIMTTFLDKLLKNNCQILSYKSNVVGKAQLVRGVFKFSDITVKPIVKVKTSEEIEKIEKLLDASAKECMVSNSLNIKVKTESVVTK